MKFNNPSEYKPGDVLISSDAIRQRLQELAPAIVQFYKNKKVIIVGILKGSIIVISDLVRELHRSGLTDSVITMITIKSYGANTVSSKKPQITYDADINLKNRHVLLVEDIVDTGHTFQFVHQMIEKRGALSIRSFALLSKPDRREVEYNPDYVGFVIPNIWVQGYGLDTDEWGRGNPSVIVGPYQVG